MAERGQTETLGFVLVFALILTSIGVVYATGLTGLQDARDVQRIDNAQRAFEVLGDNIEDITFRGAPSRATEIRIADARLFLGDAVLVNVSVPQDNTSIAYDVRPVVFSADTGSRITSVQGAIIRRQGSNGVVVQEAGLILTTNRTVIPIIQTRLAQNADQAVAGTTTVLVRADKARAFLAYSNTSASNEVLFNITGTPRAGIWADYLNRTTDATCSKPGPEAVSCEVTTDRVRITVVQIDVELE